MAYIWLIRIEYDGKQDCFNVIATDEEHARKTGQYIIDHGIFAPSNSVITSVFTFREEVI